MSTSGSLLTAGEAGIVLSRFLPSVMLPARVGPLVDEVNGLIVRGAVVLDSFEAGVVGARTFFVGLRVLTRAAVLLSVT